MVNTYARMTGTDIKQAVEALEYFTYQDALEQIGERRLASQTDESVPSCCASRRALSFYGFRCQLSLGSLRACCRSRSADTTWA